MVYFVGFIMFVIALLEIITVSWIYGNYLLYFLEHLSVFRKLCHGQVQRPLNSFKIFSLSCRLAHISVKYEINFWSNIFFFFYDFSIRIEEHLERCGIHVGHSTGLLLEIYVGTFYSGHSGLHFHLFDIQFARVQIGWLRLPHETDRSVSVSLTYYELVEISMWFTAAGWLLSTSALIQIPIWGVYVIHTQKRGTTLLEVTTARFESRFNSIHSSLLFPAYQEQFPAFTKLGTKRFENTGRLAQVQRRNTRSSINPSLGVHLTPSGT